MQWGAERGASGKLRRGEAAQHIEQCAVAFDRFGDRGASDCRQQSALSRIAVCEVEIAHASDVRQPRHGDRNEPATGVVDSGVRELWEYPQHMRSHECSDIGWGRWRVAFAATEDKSAIGA